MVDVVWPWQVFKTSKQQVHRVARRVRSYKRHRSLAIATRRASEALSLAGGSAESGGGPGTRAQQALALGIALALAQTEDGAGGSQTQPEPEGSESAGAQVVGPPP